MNNKKIAKIISGFSVLVGITVIVGWFLDVTVLTSISPSWIRMKFATAVCFVLSGFIIYCLSLEETEKEMFKKIILTVFPMLLVLIMGTLFLGSIFGFQTGMENIAFVDVHEIATPIFQGRPAVPTMLCFILIAIIGFMASFNKGSKKLFNIFGWIVGTLGCVGLIGYLSNIKFLMYEIPGLSNSIAIHTTILFSLLGLAIILIGKNKN